MCSYGSGSSFTAIPFAFANPGSVSIAIAGYRSKFCESEVDLIRGTIGAGINLLSTEFQSTPSNHWWLLTSVAPPRRLPSRLLRSDESSRLMRSLATGST